MQLKRLRVSRKLSQARLAARAGLDPSTVNQIERGAREASPATIRKLAQALGVSIAELLDEQGKNPKEQAVIIEEFNVRDWGSPQKAIAARNRRALELKEQGYYTFGYTGRSFRGESDRYRIVAIPPDAPIALRTPENYPSKE